MKSLDRCGRNGDRTCVEQGFRAHSAGIATRPGEIVGPRDLRYLIANLLSAGGLTFVAVLNGQYGFIISNGFWMLVAAVSIALAGIPGEAPTGIEPVYTALQAAA